MQQDGAPVPSLLTPIGYQSGDCGYCKSSDSSQRTPDSRASYYVTAKFLSPEHYQELMDRGWRRSGTLLYLPDASRSCCPHYTIRLPASEFQPSRDHRQVLHRWNRFILGDKYLKDVTIKHPKSKEEKKRLNNTFDLAAAVHESEKVNLKPDLLPEHHFSVTLEPDNFTEEKYGIYEDYQRNVHHDGPDEISRHGFRRFLCSSPIRRRVDVDGKKLGSYHQCYRLDGRLIAIGILDLLPHAVSGVYFLYHTDFEKWGLGKLSALREAVLALEGSYQFYYMGYYIHGCTKMRYKGTYKPQYVLDLECHHWDLLDDEMRSLMERDRYVSMSKERKKKSKIVSADDDVLQTKSAAPSPRSALGADEEALSFPEPLEAARSGLSVLELGMPGVMSLLELQDQVNLDKMRAKLGTLGIHCMEAIVSWSEGSAVDPHSLQGVTAEFAACVGPNLAREVVVNFGT